MFGEKTKLVNKAEAKNFYFIQRNPSMSGEVELNSNPPSSEVATSSGGSYVSWFTNLLQLKTAYQRISDGQNYPRKVPIKVEPKVFFANERTFLSWLHMSVTLASISVAIVAFAEANAWSQLYGLLLMPVAIAFCVYSLYMFIRRAGMIRRKDPGPYEDMIGPIVLACLLATSIVVNFCVKLFDIASG